MDTNEYVIKTKVCRSLSKQFGLEEVIIDETKLTELIELYNKCIKSINEIN